MDLHKKFVMYGSQVLKWRRKCELLLPEINRKQIWKEKRYSSIYEYAAKLAGMSRSSVDKALWVMKKIENKPELRKVVEDKGVNSVVPVANLATKETASFWADKAASMSKNALEAYAKECRKESNLSPGKPVRVVMDLDPEIAAKLEKMKGDKSWDEFMSELINKEKPPKVQTESRYVPSKIKKHVLDQTSGKCACCNRKAEVLHHVDRFAKSHEHDPDKLVPLCEGHHQLAHLGYIANEHMSPAKWKVRDQARPSAIDLKWCSYRIRSP